MPRQRVPVQVNQFVGGLNTEANLLSFPIEATADESNMTLNRDGSRSRRKGFMGEDRGVTRFDTGLSLTEREGDELAISNYVWENPSGNLGKTLLVQQMGGLMTILDADAEFVASTELFNFSLGVANPLDYWDFATVNGNLIVCANASQVYTIKWDGTYEFSGFEILYNSLKVRDFFDTYSASQVVDGVKTRSDDFTSNSLYNLRNRSWNKLVVDGANDTVDQIDPVAAFRTYNGTNPALSDNLNRYLHANVNFSSNRTVERFNAEDIAKVTPPNADSANGFFIINVLSRGESRQEEINKLQSAYTYTHTVGSTALPEDTTSGGASVCASFGGRAWWSGFNGSVSGGDRNSPNLANYVLFSQLVQTEGDIVKCYQEADPTSSEDPDLVATDGGFLLLDGAVDIQKMIPIQNSLFVFAANGIWRIVGNDENGFSATAYTVEKVSDQGAISRGSIIQTPDSVVFWGRSDIYALVANPTGGWGTQSLSEEKIKTFYDDIPLYRKLTSKGAYDEVEDRLTWLYRYDTAGAGDTDILHYHLKYGAWTKDRVRSASSTGIPGRGLHDIVNLRSRDSEHGPIYYMSIRDWPDDISVYWGQFSEDTPVDFSNATSSFYYPAYIQTGPITGGDARLRKDIPYVTTYLKSSTRDSSCLLQAQWDWTTEVGDNRWSTPRQAYRPGRRARPLDISSTKTRIRGRGHAVSLRYESEGDSDMHLYGWDHNLESTTHE